MDRRQFMVGSLGAGSLLMLPPLARSSTPAYTLPFINAQDMAPLERLSAFGGSSVIEGDVHDEAHEIFWNKEGYLLKKGGIPQSSSQYDVIIVGGGMAGLSAAYNLRGLKVLLLEGQPRLGGNSKSQQSGKSFTSQGAAYLAAFEPGDEFDQLYTDIGVKRLLRNTGSEAEPVTMNGKLIPDFWSGATDPSRSADFKRAHDILRDVFENKLPELPLWDNSASMRTYLNSLDQMTFTNWLKREIGNVHPHVMELITLYCWSSFGGSPAELSAAQGLYFFASDTQGGANVLPGGNGRVAHAMYEKMKTRGNVTFRSNAFAIDVRSLNGKAQVCFKNESGVLETATAKKCIVASPKKVAKFVVDKLSAGQHKAMDDIDYRAYLVANIFLNKKVASPGYDVYSLQGSNPTNDYEDSKKRCMADMLFADWASKDNVDQTILTLYLPLPYDMAQQYLFVDGLYEKYKDRVKTSIAPHLSNMGLSWSNVQGMRLVRYGHSVPLAKAGQIANGTFERASADIDGCIFFANQDNWGNPCFETSYGSALQAARKAR